MVDRVHGFDIIRHVHLSPKDGSGFRMLVPSITYVRILQKQIDIVRLQPEVASASSVVSGFLTFLASLSLSSRRVSSIASFDQPLRLIDHLL